MTVMVQTFNRSGRLFIKVNLTAWVVLNNQALDAFSDLKHLSAAFGSHYRSCWIMKRRDCINYFRLMFITNILKNIYAHSILINRHGEDGSTSPPKHINRSWIGRR